MWVTVIDMQLYLIRKRSVTTNSGSSRLSGGQSCSDAANPFVCLVRPLAHLLDFVLHTGAICPSLPHLWHVASLNLQSLATAVISMATTSTSPHNLNDQLGDFCDGSIFKEHPIFSTDPHALQVVAYYDELEVVNPIGSFVKRHKLGCVFFFLANVRPQLRSTLKSIQLIAVAKHQDVQQYGIDDLLSPFVEELKTLYCDGINVSIAGQERVLHGALLAFLADTLAAHSVGGFKESMGFALRICRTCMITRPLSQSCFSETDSECVLRTPATHFEQCSLLQGELCHHYSTSYGVNRLFLKKYLHFQ